MWKQKHSNLKVFNCVSVSHWKQKKSSAFLESNKLSSQTTHIAKSVLILYHRDARDRLLFERTLNLLTYICWYLKHNAISFNKRSFCYSDFIIIYCLFMFGASFNLTFKKCATRTNAKARIYLVHLRNGRWNRVLLCCVFVYTSRVAACKACSAPRKI